jgi:hypothetical protein
VDGVTTEKIGGIWHGYLEGHPEIDERALTEEIARQEGGIRREAPQS